MIGFFKKRLRLLVIIVLIIAGFLVYRQYYLLPKSQDKDSTKVKRGDLREELTISGDIDADEKATLRFKTSGKLVWVGVKEGDFVKKYQMVASLDQRELQKTLQKELNDYMDERWDFEQVNEDYEDDLKTNEIRRILEQAQFDLENTVLDVELQDLAIEYANLWSPIEGIVTYVEAPYPGVNITSTQAEFEVINPATIYFSAIADQTEVTKLRNGLSGELVLDAYPDDTFVGNISNISFIPKSGETGTVYSVKFVFANTNSDNRYRIGMAGDLTFITEEKTDVLYLPVKYVKQEEGKKYVEIMSDKGLEKVFIEIGLETDNNVEIVSGIEEGVEVYN